MIINDMPVHVPQQILISEQIRPEDCLFFDIETTGLSWRRSHLYLLGAVFYENDRWIHRQWFCQRPGEEAEVLSRFSLLLNSRKTLVHYNGNTFDVPYLMHKYTFYRMEQDWEHLTSFDLYQIFHPFKKIFRLEHMRQKDLEVFTGQYRKDPFTGEQLISCYEEYLGTGDERLLHALLLHNKEDVEGMIGLLPLLRIVHAFRGDIGKTDLHLEALSDAEKNLALTFSLDGAPRVSIDFQTDWYNLSLSANGGLLQVPVVRGTRKFFYEDYKNYYYLPLEDEAIHKSVAVYVDSEHREKAKACNCYKKITGEFLPQFSSWYSPQFFDNYKDKVSWFPCTEEFVSSPARLDAYARHLLAQSLSLVP